MSKTIDQREREIRDYVSKYEYGSTFARDDVKHLLSLIDAKQAELEVNIETHLEMLMPKGLQIGLGVDSNDQRDMSQRIMRLIKHCVDMNDRIKHLESALAAAKAGLCGRCKHGPCCVTCKVKAEVTYTITASCARVVTSCTGFKEKK